jgi:hypothetical protein
MQGRKADRLLTAAKGLPVSYPWKQQAGKGLPGAYPWLQQGRDMHGRKADICCKRSVSLIPLSATRRIQAVKGLPGAYPWLQQGRDMQGRKADRLQNIQLHETPVGLNVAWRGNDRKIILIMKQLFI